MDVFLALSEAKLGNMGIDDGILECIVQNIGVLTLCQGHVFWHPLASSQWLLVDIIFIFNCSKFG